VAVNPYKEISGLYSLQTVKKYQGVPIGELPPHIFAIGNATYYSLQRTKVNQCVVIRYGTSILDHSEDSWYSLKPPI